MIIQSDADGTIYQGNLLVSLGWSYIRFLFGKKKYLLFADRLIKLPFFYFFSHLPFFINTAFIPLKDCPLELVNGIKKPLKKKWLEAVTRLNPEKIIIVSRQDRNILQAFINQRPELKKYNLEIVANEAVIKEGKFTGKFKISINPYHKHEYVNPDLFYLGDLRDYLLWGRKRSNFILI
jgi:hypothetical protein